MQASGMENIYKKRKVADKDTSACFVCYKPTQTVLQHKSGHDWFYCCDLHLQDNPQFAQPIYSHDYHSAVAHTKKLAIMLKQETKKTTSSWDSWFNKLVAYKSTGDGTVQNTGKTDKEKDIQPDTSISAQYQEAVDSLVKIKNSCKTYSLNSVVFHSRVQMLNDIKRLQEQKQKKREAYSNTKPDELLAKYEFPEVPKV